MPDGAFVNRRNKAAAVATILLGVSSAATTVHAENAPLLPAAITYSTSTGYWEDSGTTPAQRPATSGQPEAVTSPAADPAAKTAPRHGYYKLFAVRQADRTSKLYLQLIVAGDDAVVLSTTEIPEIGGMKAQVTDIRPENSGGIIKEPGLFATVYLKVDPDADAEVWNVMLDEFGEVTVEKASE
jgi:hypothetical protein